jgi:sugar diacid utilization regulator
VHERVFEQRELRARAVISIDPVGSLRELVASPVLNGMLSWLARPRADPVVRCVALVEDLRDVRPPGDGALALLTHGASERASGYGLDIALRLARSRRVAALVLTSGDLGGVTPASVALAARSGIAILAAPPVADLAQLAVAIGRELAGGADAALLRAHTAMRAADAHPAGAQPGTLLRHAGAAYGVPLTLADREPAAGPRAPVRVEDRVEAWVTAAPQDGDMALGLDLVLRVVAAREGEALARARRAEELPIQSREEVLTELLTSPLQGRAALVRGARSLGVPIDGWHVAVRLELESLAEPDGPAAAYEARQAFARAALQAIGADGGTWHSARAGTAHLLLRMYREDPGAGAGSAVARAVDEALRGLRSRLPAAIVHCGVGSAYAGAAGLLSSAGEAKAAATTGRASGRVNTAVPFDSVGLRRTLVEWYASDTAQEAVTTVLAPLSNLGGARAERLLQTLHVYLDQRGSLTRTAETLHLHRNAVAYRMNQIFELLDVDADNPDDLLLLQLACRARELA